MKHIIKLFCMVLLYLFQILTGKNNVSAQSFTVDTILYNGTPDKFINFVFMGDGFQTSGFSDFSTNVQNTSDYLFNISPFAEYKSYFNVFAIRVPSTDSGTDHPRTAPDCQNETSHPVLSVNTYFNSTFDYNFIHRLLVPSYSLVNNVLINNFPLHDQKFVLINSPYYGGSGSSNGTATASLHTSSLAIMVHELGHSFAGLADEYYAGDSYASERPNMTQLTNPALVKWKNWMGSDNVGIYQHCCSGNSAQWYRPHQNCLMRTMGVYFCPVCKETIVQKIHQLFGTPINSYSPNQTIISYCTQPIQFEVSLIKPIPNTLRIKWKLNGNDIAMNIDSITISSGELNIGSNALSVQVLDTTSFIRDSLHMINQIYTINWTINYNPLSPPTLTASGATTFCQGDSVMLTASTANSYLWSDGSTTQSITVSTSSNYSVTVTDENGCSTTSTPEAIEVNVADTSITVNEFALTSNATSATYQWLTCPTFSIISGEINQSYFPSQNGSYAAMITQNGCTDTSNCYQVTATGLLFTSDATSIVVYPNPTNSLLTVKSIGLVNDTYKMTLSNSLGQLLNEKEIKVKGKTLETQFDIFEHSTGIYFLTISSKTINHVFKIQKQ